MKAIIEKCRKNDLVNYLRIPLLFCLLKIFARRKLFFSAADMCIDHISFFKDPLWQV